LGISSYLVCDALNDWGRAVLYIHDYFISYCTLYKIKTADH